MNLHLAGKHAIVCGSSQGIGKACAAELASLGASITLLARNEAALASVRDELPTDQDQTHRVLIADFANPDTVERAIAGFIGETSGADILINNTGGPPGGPAIDADPDAYLAAFQMHIVCNQLLVQALAPGMKTKGWGRIVNIISTSVKAPIAGLGVSNTVRGAVASWAKTIATELAPFGVTVNNILPGFTNTTRLDALICARANRADTSIERIAVSMRESVPMGRFAEASEIAQAAAFLCTSAASYITGVSLAVDGGRTNCL